MKLRSSKMAALSSKARKNPALRGRCIRRWWGCNESVATKMHKIHKRIFLCVFCAFLWLFPFIAFAAGDRFVFGLQAAYGLENGIPRNISHIQMLYAQPQVGYVVWNSSESRLPIKRFDIVSEGIVGGSTHPGGHVFGDTLMFRVMGNSARRYSPFFSVSSGPLHTTLNEHASELGGHVQFLSQGGAGIQRRLDA